MPASASTPSAQNGSVTTPSASPVPYTGTATGQDVDQKMVLSFVFGLVAAVLLL